jgi:hypothetical protein
LATTQTWLGGGNNEWNNPADWSPTGTPGPRDTLIMNGGTINIKNTNLYGDTLNLATNSYDQINLNGGVVLNLAGNAGPDINVNAPGAILHSNIGSAYYLERTINFAPGTQLIFSGTMGGIDGGGITISGNGTLIDNGEIITSHAVIDSNVLGNGTMMFTSTHDGGPGGAELWGASSGGITYELTNIGEGVNMIVEHPSTFASKVEIVDRGSVTLVGLAATSYDLRRDFLTLYQGNKPVYHLNVADQSSDGQPVYVTSSTGGVTVGVSPPGWAPLFGPPSTDLPQHTTPGA